MSNRTYCFPHGPLYSEKWSSLQLSQPGLSYSPCVNTHQGRNTLLTCCLRTRQERSGSSSPRPCLVGCTGLLSLTSPTAFKVKTVMRMTTAPAFGVKVSLCLFAINKSNQTACDHFCFLEEDTHWSLRCIMSASPDPFAVQLHAPTRKLINSLTGSTNLSVFR